MPRHARRVIAGVPHHITIRGNNRQQVFFCPDDYIAFLHLLRQLATAANMLVDAYCLMINHGHFILTPPSKEALSAVMGKLQQDYTLRIKARLNFTGHLWGNRFFSCPMDEDYFVYAMRYVECNPVRVNLVRQPWAYLWSSAQAHVTGRDPYRILAMEYWLAQYQPEAWKALIEQPLALRDVEYIRRQTFAGQLLRASRPR